MVTSISSDAFQCAYCKADLGWKAYCIGRVEYKVCTKPKPACFVTQQFKEGEFKISRGCGSEMEYQKAKNSCRESPKTCPLINRCNGSKCVATYPSEYLYIIYLLYRKSVPNSLLFWPIRHLCLQQCARSRKSIARGSLERFWSVVAFRAKEKAFAIKFPSGSFSKRT